MSRTDQSVKRGKGDRSLTHDPAKLRWHRIAAGLSLTEAADEAGYSKGQLSMLENGGYHSASPGCLRELARVYRCKIRDLMPDEPKGSAA
jgi:transcriptional regulator with XRE-family HTH domain